jgi:hypothetical protein
MGFNWAFKGLKEKDVFPKPEHQGTQMYEFNLFNA